MGAVGDALGFIQQLISSLDYAGIALATALVAPELVMPFAGFLTARGELSFVGALAAGTLGATFGLSVIYGVARAVGERRVRAFFRAHGRLLFVHERDLERALELFDRLEDGVVLFGRFIPTVRSLISVPAGIKAMPLGRFLLLTTLGTALWNALLLSLGALLGRNWRQVLSFLETYQTVVWLGLGALLVVFVVQRLRERAASS